MWQVTVYLTILSLSYAASDTKVGIVNGTDAKEGEYKFAVSLRHNGGHYCGGSILNPRHVLTAAHCVCETKGIPRNPKLYAIQYGSLKISSTSERVVPVSTIFCNKLNYSLSVFNDVAVVKLEHDIPDDGTWEPVKLVRNFNSSSDSKGVIIGWGQISILGPAPETLQKLEVDIYNDTLCDEQFYKEQHICLGAKLGGICYGDSGTALLTLDNQQIGICSRMSNKCGIANRLTPNVYDRVDYFYSWIEEHSKYE